MRQEILQTLEPLFAEAERDGKWFHHNSMMVGPLWFSPGELRAEHEKGKFIWGAVNWRLRDPLEGLKQIADDRARSEAELGAFRKRMAK